MCFGSIHKLTFWLILWLDVFREQSTEGETDHRWQKRRRNVTANAGTSPTLWMLLGQLSAKTAVCHRWENRMRTSIHPRHKHRQSWHLYFSSIWPAQVFSSALRRTPEVHNWPANGPDGRSGGGWPFPCVTFIKLWTRFVLSLENVSGACLWTLVPSCCTAVVVVVCYIYMQTLM